MMKCDFKIPNAKEARSKRKLKRGRGPNDRPVVQSEHLATHAVDSRSSTQCANSSHGAREEWSDTISFTLPATASMYSDAPNMMGLADSLLLPEDQSRYEGLGVSATADLAVSRMIQAISLTVFLRRTVQAQEKRNQDLLNTNAALKKQNANLVEKDKELQAKIRADSAKYEKLYNEHQMCASRIQALTERLESIFVDAVLKTRAELMAEFKAGKSSEWNPDEEIQIWQEIEAELAEELEEGTV